MNSDLFINQYFPSTIWDIIEIDDYFEVVKAGIQLLRFYNTKNIFTRYFVEFDISEDNKESTLTILYILRSLSYLDNDLFQQSIKDYLESNEIKYIPKFIEYLVLAGYSGFKIQDNNGYFTFDDKFTTNNTDYLNLGYIRRFPELMEYNLFTIEQELVDAKIINNDDEIIKYFDEYDQPEIIVRTQRDTNETIKPKRKYVIKEYKNTGNISSALSTLKLDTTYIGTNKAIQYLRMF